MKCAIYAHEIVKLCSKCAYMCNRFGVRGAERSIFMVTFWLILPDYSLA